jgi:serine/threonine protein phosphatase PrpC
LQNTKAFKTAPLESITYMITECDKQLAASPLGIDVSISGTTAVVAVISELLHVGSVGDSRAVLGMCGNRDPEYVPGKRHVEPARALAAMRMTLDQRPNLREELERIKKAGGKVQQLTNDQGARVGPYRVWKKTGTLPGLSMSRSIGDAIGKTIGVISTPVCQSFMFDNKNDLFLVLATDGIWDVMNCTEVVHFVEKFRNLCRKEADCEGFPVKVRDK